MTKTAQRRLVLREIEETKAGRLSSQWAAGRSLAPFPPLSLAEYPGYTIVHGHDEGGACNRRCRYQKTLRHAIASRVSALKGRFL